MGDPAPAGFVGAYRDALRRHVDRPSERSLHDAYELGRRALAHGMSLLDLIGIHHSLRDHVLASPSERLERADSFLQEGLASFEIASLAVREAQAMAAAERERTEVLGHLSDAHLAILAAPSVQARLQIVCERAMALVGGSRARVALGGGVGAQRIASRGARAARPPPPR